MPTSDEILADADAALTEAVAADRAHQVPAMRRFMTAFEQLGLEAFHGRPAWTAARAWALRVAPRFVLAKDALAAWHDQLWHQLQHNGEEGAEVALRWRSQSAIAARLFEGTPAAELLASHDDAEFDEELHDQAENVAMDAADWAPRSHAWWRWGEWRLGRPIAPEVAFEDPAPPGPMKRNPTMPPAARAAIVQRLARESDHAGALPDPLPLDRVLMPVDRAKRTTEQLRIKAGQDAQGYFLDFYKVDARDQASFHGRIRDDGSAQPLENIEGQHGRRASADPAETERERQRVIANNERAREILRTKGFL